MSNAERLADLRKRLAATQVAARNAREDLAIDRAQAEAAAIEAAGGEKALGANAEARERALTLALSLNGHYQTRLVALRELERVVTELDAELEAAKDARREAEWGIRLRLAAALDGRGVQTNGLDSELGDDGSFDDAADSAATSRVVEQAEAVAVAAEAIDPDDLPF